MGERRRYTITTENVVTTGDFTDEEIERIRRKFHGFVNITPTWEGFEFDFDAIAKELVK